MGLIKGTIGLFAAIGAALLSILALVIVIYTATQLSHVSYSYNNLGTETFCALGKATNITIGSKTFDPALYASIVSSGDSNCLLLEILGGITIGLGIVIGIIQCYTCHLCGFGGILDFIFGVAGTAAWLAASIVVTDVYNANKTLVDPAVSAFNQKRYTVMVMCWIEFGFFGSIVLSGISKCCSLCGTGRKGSHGV